MTRHAIAARIVLVARAARSPSLSAGGQRRSRLVEAVQAGNREAVRALLQKPAEVNAAEADGTTALHWAVRADDLETGAGCCSRAGAKANAANRYGVTPLTLAAVNGNAAIVETLLDSRRRRQQRRARRGQTVLMTAARDRQRRRGAGAARPRRQRQRAGRRSSARPR